MILIPQLYIKGKKVVALERTVSPIYDEDPFLMAQKMKAAGAETLYIVDLGIQNVGAGENAPIISKIREELKFDIYLGGAFRSTRAIEAYMAMDIKAVVLETVAYQQPALVKEATAHFPDRVAVQILVRGGRVTIPGWTVAANKTAFDYAEQFSELGVKTFFYSDVGNDGLITQKNFDNILTFCKKVGKSVICNSEIAGSGDIEKLALLGAPTLEGLVVARALYEGRIDLRAAIDLIADLSLAPGNEPTLLEE